MRHHASQKQHAPPKEWEIVWFEILRELSKFERGLGETPSIVTEDELKNAVTIVRAIDPRRAEADYRTHDKWIDKRFLKCGWIEKANSPHTFKILYRNPNVQSEIAQVTATATKPQRTMEEAKEVIKKALEKYEEEEKPPQAV